MARLLALVVAGVSVLVVVGRLLVGLQGLNAGARRASKVDNAGVAGRDRDDGEGWLEEDLAVVGGVVLFDCEGDLAVTLEKEVE